MGLAFRPWRRWICRWKVGIFGRAPMIFLRHLLPGLKLRSLEPTEGVVCFVHGFGLEEEKEMQKIEIFGDLLSWFKKT